MFGNDGGGNLVHLRAAVFFRNVDVGDADLAGLADQLACDGKFLVLDLLDVGQNLILRKLLRRLCNLPVLFAQVLECEDVIELVFFNQETPADEFCLRGNCYGCHKLSSLNYETF